MSLTRPNNSIIHMTIFGVAIGAGVGILSMLGLLVITVFSVPNYPLVRLAAEVFFGLYFGLAMGGVVGAIIGVLNGTLVKFLLRNAVFPLQDGEKTRYNRLVNRSVGALTAISSLLVMIVAAGEFFVLMLLPAALAALGMMYGVRFFLARWQAYTGLAERDIYADDPERTVRSAWLSTGVYPAVEDPDEAGRREDEAAGRRPRRARRRLDAHSAGAPARR